MIATMRETEKDSTTTPARLSLTGIDFAYSDPVSKDLTRPIYPTLVDYPMKPTDQVQVDLGIQVGRGEDALEIALELQEGAGVSFTPEEGFGVPEAVKCRDLADPENPSPVGVHAILEGTNPPRCIFHWSRVEGLPRVRAFRIFCEEKVPPTPQEIVYGGLFVAIIDSPRPELSPIPSAPKHAVTSLAHLELLGIGDAGRPLYNIFKDYRGLISPPAADVEIEPTYRVYERQEIRFDLTLKVPDWTFNEELRLLTPPNAGTRFAFTFGPANCCHFGWTRLDAGLASSNIGSTATCHLGVDIGEVPDEFFEQLGRELGWEALPLPPKDRKLRQILFRSHESIVDPTVIEPPRCSGGICVG